jgi:hypothetical protein
MRYLLAAMIVCTVATPASALPAVGPTNAPSVMKAAPIVQVAKSSRTSAVRHRHGLGGIHPLVGSGDY